MKCLDYQNPQQKKKLEKLIRSLSKKYHPDLNKADDAVEKFKEVTEAYEVLSDESKKANYDQIWAYGSESRISVAVAELTVLDLKIYSVRFSEAIHVRRDPNAPRKGNDLQYSMTIDFMEAVFGKETEIEIPREETCDTCDGSGAKKGTTA